MTAQPFQAAFESQIVRTLRSMGLDVGFGTARNVLLVLCTVGILPLAYLATVAAALLAAGRTGPVTVGGAAVGTPAAVLAAWWLLQPLGEWVRRWSPRPPGRREPGLRYAQSALGCDTRSLLLVEVLLPGVLKLAPLAVFSVAVLTRPAGRADRVLAAAAMAAGAVLLLAAWRRAAHEVGGTRTGPHTHLGPAVALPVAALAGLLAGRVVETWDEPVPRPALPEPVLIAAAVLLAVLAAGQLVRLARATIAAGGRPLRPAAAPGVAAGSGEPAGLGASRRRWTVSFWRPPLRAGALGVRPLVVVTAGLVAAPAVAGRLAGIRFGPTVGGFLALSLLAAAVGNTPGRNLVTAGPSHRLRYELGYPRRLGFWLYAATESARVLVPAGVLTVLWAAVWPAVWYLPTLVASGAVAGALLADALLGNGATVRVSELQRVAFSSVVLAVAFVVWQVGTHSLPAAGAVAVVALLIGEETWAYKIQRIRLS